MQDCLFVNKTKRSTSSSIIQNKKKIPGAGTRHGRIHPHQRETDNTTQTIGANIQIENFETDFHKTKDLEMSKAV